MLARSDTPISDVLPLFAQQGIPVTFLVPTPTGYGKSIMDAIGDVRLFLKEAGLHNYDLQGQGQENKVIITAYFVYSDRYEKTYASLYRPQTKQGDPRIWFANLKKYCKPDNLLAITVYRNELYVINLSDLALRNALTDPNTAPYNLMMSIISDANSISNELLEKLRVIHQMGFVPTVKSGDTGVGMTLENLLGLPPNCNRNPDYKGIELKSSRMSDRTPMPNRVNLYTQVPDWSISRYNAMGILKRFGYIKDGRLQLYCTVSNKPNPQGLYFEVNSDEDLLENIASTNIGREDVAKWSLLKLRTELAKKHNETFWIKAATTFENGIEYFRYDKVIHTKTPNVYLFGHLVESGIITMDYTLSQKNERVRDHGYIFKLHPRNIDLLFPHPIEYIL
ncbi:MAG: MvaI/BcnI restriction endonuclease family protein [Lentisphaeria bacterium]|nr:MvaI/BcnI restriction endonuclease family protein [Lentisphaeria bacterium]